VKRLALIALSLVIADRADAAGFYLSDLGARGLARGGAFVASPDTLLAMHYNPAGLAGQRGALAELDLSLFSGSFTIERKCPCVYPDRITDQDPAALDAAIASGFGVTENRAGARVIPFLSLGYGFETLDLTIAAAAYGPHGAGYEWSGRDYAEALQLDTRYSLVEADSIEANYQLAVALSPLPGLRIGASFFLYQVKSTQFLHIYANTLLTPFAENVSTIIENNDQPFDIPIELAFERIAPGWSVGASYELLDGLSLGASFRGPRPVKASGRLNAELPPILSEAEIAIENGGGDVEVRFTLPAIARAGVAYRVPGLFNAEVAAVWEGWSVHDKIEIQADTVRLTVGEDLASSLGTITLQRQWQNTMSLRVGAELELFAPRFTASAGYFYEPSAIPAQRLSASAIDSEKHGISVGARVGLFGATIELALAQVLMAGREVTDSTVELPAPLRNRTPEDQDAFGTDRYQTRIGNGAYKAGATIGTVGITYRY
jgi:long-subunit fatty acid transport protein